MPSSISSGAAAVKSESLFFCVLILIGVLLVGLLVVTGLDCVVLFWNSFFSWKFLEKGLLKLMPSLKLEVPLKDAFLVLSINDWSISSMKRDGSLNVRLPQR